MALPDLNSLSLDELKSLQKNVASAIADFEDRKREEARRALEELARQKGFSFEELAAISSKKKRKPVAPKYAHPENPDITWSGRGRKPRWVTAALDSGKSLDDLAI
jgi:DNA-binding protein H-NS